MNIIDKEKTCCFFGHRKIEETKELTENLYEIINSLIINEKVDTFLFGSKSKFNSLCHKIVTKLKEKYPHIKRVYVRSAYQHIDENYKNYLLERYEDTYYPKHIENSGKASYVERNQEMINNSKFCIIYYDENYVPPVRTEKFRIYQPKSGTSIAYGYALKKKLVVTNVFPCNNQNL